MTQFTAKWYAIQQWKLTKIPWLVVVAVEVSIHFVFVVKWNCSNFFFKLSEIEITLENLAIVSQVQILFW